MRFRASTCRRLVEVALVCALAGCTTLQGPPAPPPARCTEQEPHRPVMPTEQLELGTNVDVFVQAAQAEILRREGYEVLLRMALGNCVMR